LPSGDPADIFLKQSAIGPPAAVNSKRFASVWVVINMESYVNVGFKGSETQAPSAREEINRRRELHCFPLLIGRLSWG
jgi:hypothetical protein